MLCFQRSSATSQNNQLQFEEVPTPDQSAGSRIQVYYFFRLSVVDLYSQIHRADPSLGRSDVQDSFATSMPGPYPCQIYNTMCT